MATGEPPHESERFIGQIIAACAALGRSDFVMVNVGALDAYEARKVAEAFPAARVIAFEADPELAKKYARSAGPVEYHGLALSDTSGPATYYPQRGEGLGGLRRRNGKKYEKTRQIPAIRLDEWCGELRPDVLFIDTEGTDYEVLVGAGDLLDSVSIVIAEAQLEAGTFNGGHTKDDIDALLGEHGLGVSPYWGYSVGLQGNFFWIRRDENHAAIGGNRNG